MDCLHRTTEECLLVLFCCVVLLSGCGGNPAASTPSEDLSGGQFWDIGGVQKEPAAVWTYVWNQSYENQIIPCLGTATGGKLYQGGRGLLELDTKTGRELLNVNWTKKNHIFLQGPLIVSQDKRLYGILSEQKVTEMLGVGMLYQRLSCLDATTGKVLWQSDEIGTGEKPSGNPLLLNGKLYCAACFPILPSGADYSFDVHPAVGIWDAVTGKLTGRITLPSGTFPYQTNLTSDGTSVYGNAYYQVAWGHCRSMIFRYDPATAQTVWSISYPTVSNDFANMSVALAVDGETLMAVFRAEDSPYKADGTTIPTATHHVAAAFDTTDGHMLWSKTGEISSSSSSEQDPEIAMRSGTAFLTVHDGTLIAIDERTGTQKWSLTVEKAPTPTASIEGPPIYWYDRLIPMVTRDVLYVREGDRTLIAIDPETGAKFWQKTLLTKEDLWEKKKQLCSVIPVDKGIIVVTANSSDLRPIVEMWK